jgi:hypothetical protein
MQLSDFSPTIPTPEQLHSIQLANYDYKKLAQVILTDPLIPPSAHRTAALRLLLESKMTLIHGITHPQP